MQKPAPVEAIRLVDSVTGRLVMCRATKIIQTKATPSPGATLCRAHLDGTCTKGADCPMIHCISKEHVWEPIALPAEVNPNELYPAGWMMRVYDSDLSTYMEVPSTYFMPTQGSAAYIEQFNKRGEQVKTQFKICRGFRETGNCAAGSNCVDLHCTAPDLASFKCHVTHTNEESSLSKFPCLPHGFIVRVFVQNSPHEYDDFSSERVLYTYGAEKYLEAYRAENNQIPKKKMQHCAHFRIKRLCRLGSKCKFIHAVPLVHPRVDVDALSISNSGPTTPRSDSGELSMSSTDIRPKSPAEGDQRRVKVKVRQPNGVRSTSPTYATASYIDDGADNDTPTVPISPEQPSLEHRTDSGNQLHLSYNQMASMSTNSPTTPPSTYIPGGAPPSIPAMPPATNVYQGQYDPAQQQQPQPQYPPQQESYVTAAPTGAADPYALPSPTAQGSYDYSQPQAQAYPQQPPPQQQAPPMGGGVQIRVGGVVMPHVNVPENAQFTSHTGTQQYPQ